MKQSQKWLPLANLAMCAVILVLMLLDLFWPRWNLFLNSFVKGFLLVACLLSALNGWRLYARMRRSRRRMRRPRPRM